VKGTIVQLQNGSSHHIGNTFWLVGIG